MLEDAELLLDMSAMSFLFDCFSLPSRAPPSNIRSGRCAVFKKVGNNLGFCRKKKIQSKHAENAKFGEKIKLFPNFGKE